MNATIKFRACGLSPLAKLPLVEKYPFRSILTGCGTAHTALILCRYTEALIWVDPSLVSSKTNDIPVCYIYVLPLAVFCGCWGCCHHRRHTRLGSDVGRLITAVPWLISVNQPALLFLMAIKVRLHSPHNFVGNHHLTFSLQPGLNKNFPHWTLRSKRFIESNQPPTVFRSGFCLHFLCFMFLGKFLFLQAEKTNSCSQYRFSVFSHCFSLCKYKLTQTTIGSNTSGYLWLGSTCVSLGTSKASSLNAERLVRNFMNVMITLYDLKAIYADKSMTQDQGAGR